MDYKTLNYSVDVGRGGLNAVLIQGDEYAMNWIDGDASFGTFYDKYKLLEQNVTPEFVREKFNYKGLSVYVTRYVKDRHIVNDYKFVNESDSEMNFAFGELGIATPFNDNYESAEICKFKRCHEHIWVSDNVAYIAAKRMDGSNDNLALLMTKGRAGGYAVKRGWNSNDRGDAYIILPELKILPKESAEYTLELFSYGDFDDFYEKALSNRQFIRVSADSYSSKIGEKIKLSYAYSEDIELATDSGKAVIKNGRGEQTIALSEYGENKFNIEYNGYRTFIELYAHDGNLNEIDKRIEFIIDKQFISERGRMYGAFTLYDNETEEQYLENVPMNDRGPARERMGMVLSMMERVKNGVKLQEEFKDAIIKTVKLHLNFIDNYIVKNSGKVCEAPKYKVKWYCHRLYNYSWAMLVYVTAYELFGENRYLIKACNIAREYYRRGGAKFYAINLPFERIVNACIQANMTVLSEEMYDLFTRHGDNVIDISTNWPPHEVKYEQSITAPSIDILLECYNLTKEPKYLTEAEKQLPLLSAFNGDEPSFHCNEVSVRHWDGYWFGKKKMYGDTFPHYWSCITAAVYSKYSAITEKEEYRKKADKCLDNNLCLISGGRGSCAYLYPDFINGNRGKYYDPWANDQDWVMWFNLKYNSKLNLLLNK